MQSLIKNLSWLRHIILYQIFFISFVFPQKEIKESIEKLKKEKEKKKLELKEGWNFGGLSSILFNQVSLTNWAAGGQNSITIAGKSNLFLHYIKNKIKWFNFLDMSYALQKVGDDKGFQKNDDRINFNSRFGYKAADKMFYTALLDFKSQFTPTFRDSQLVSHFFAPAWLTTAIGMEYKPSKIISLFFAPLAGKFTFVQNQELANQGAYGVQPAVTDSITGTTTPGKMFRSEIGAYLTVLYQHEIKKNIILKSMLELFNNYSDPNKPNRKNIDIIWQNWINFKLYKYITVAFSFHLIYDHDIDIAIDKDGDGIKESTGPRTQINQTLGIGLIYQFKEKENKKK